MTAAGEPREIAIRAPRRDELARIARLIGRLQEGPQPCTAYLGQSAEEIAAEIRRWGDWPEQSLVAERGAELVGFVGADVDLELGRAWLYGPCLDAAEWDELADTLLERALADTVRGVADVQLGASVENERVQALALRHGFQQGTPNAVLEIAKDTVVRLPDADAPLLAPPRHEDFAALHDSVFPDTYYSGKQLVEQHSRGEAIVVTLVEDGRVTGYAAGRVAEDGEGFVDFVGVAEDARSAGRGRALVTAISRRLVDAGARSKVALSVREDNAPALAVYEGLGFTRTTGMAVGYRRRPAG